MTQPSRVHALDAARAFALLLGVVLHATMSFFLPIPAADRSPSVALGVTFYVIHMFRMTLFFVIAGFFAHMAYHRRGARAFIKDRAKRIVVPMTVGWVLLAPLTIGMVIWGQSRALASAQPAAAAAAAAAAAVVPQGLPLTHLWFLYYLCLSYVMVLSARWAVVRFLDANGTLRNRADTLLAAALEWFLAPALLAAPLFAVFVADTKWVAWFGIATPDVGLTPQLPALAGLLTAFVFGWLLHRQKTLLTLIERQWMIHLGLAIALTVGCLSMIGVTPSLTATSFVNEAGMRAAYAAAYTVAIWCWTFGLLGTALRFFSDENAKRRYIADASYWIYLVHLPIVFALQVIVARWPLHWSVKFPLIITVTVALLLVSYRYLVRSTLIGEVLNGRRYAGRAALPATSVSATNESFDGKPLTSLAQLTHVTKRYGTHLALNDVSLNVRHGELLAILGPNGAGKSTAIGLWLGTLEADGGEVQVMGGSPFEVQNRLGVGVMMQEVTLASALTGREHIALTASYYRNPMTVDEAVSLTGISGIVDVRHGKLSAGQKRQVQFATAVVGRPQLLFLDEPTVGLDVEARETMWRTIRELVASGCSVVLTTHYLEEAEALADRVIVLANGKMIAEGSVEEMRALVTRKRISCASVLEATDIRSWPGVIDAERDSRLVHVTALDAEAVVRRLLDADPSLSHLEVKQASLAEAFQALTKEAA